MNFVSKNNPWLNRGGNNNDADAGVFYVHSNNGDANKYNSFRSVLLETTL